MAYDYDCNINTDPTDTDETRDYLVTATVQLAVPASSRADARASVAMALADLVDRSPLCNDSMNGYVIDDIEDLSQED